MKKKRNKASLKSRVRIYASALLALTLMIGLAACGKKETPPPPPPLTPPPRPQPGPGGPIGGGFPAPVAGACGQVGQFALPRPFQGRLFPLGGGGGFGRGSNLTSHAISVNIGFRDLFLDNASISANIVLDFNELLGVGGFNQNWITQFCASSVALRTGQIQEGIARQANDSIELYNFLLTGQANVPAISAAGFGSANGNQGGFVPETVFVEIVDGSYLHRSSERVIGQVNIRFGSGATFSFETR